MSPSDNPKVSVCIPTYNCAGYLRLAIASVLAQNYQNLEIVIVDNCSTDSTVILVEEFAKNSDNNIRFYRNGRNIGLVGNLNRCLEYARGTYIKFLMADDVLLPNCLERMAFWLDSKQDITLVACGRRIIDEYGQELAVHRYSSGQVVVSGSQAIAECLFGSNFIGEPTAVMFRKSSLKGKFREDLPQVLDMDMWFRLLEQGDLLYIGEPYCAVRRHADQMTLANIKSGALVDDNIKLFETYSHKSYIKYSLRLSIQHKIYMTYRVWISRKYVSDKKRRDVLNRYGSTVVYWLIPVAWFLLSFVKRTIAIFKKLVQSRSSMYCM